MQVLILFLGEVLLAAHLAVQRARYVVAAVADTLYLGYLAQHGSYLGLGLVAEMRVAYTVKILGNLYLHVVANALVFLDTAEQLVERRVVLCAQQLTHEAEHPLRPFGKQLYFLLRFENRQFRSLHDRVATDVTQAELILAVLRLRLDEPADSLLDLRDEPY